MQVDIKTTTVTQLRQTFSHTARALGGDKPASRYQEATYGLQPSANFHYRPLWQPEMELYDVRRTKLVMRDWYALKDPRQYYYGSYTIARSRQQDAMEKNLEFVEKRGLLRDLAAPLRAKLVHTLVPLRHLEWGANTNNCYITAYGFGVAITQATMFHAMDRLGLAQYVSRIGLSLDGNSGEALAEGKRLWMEDASWQGLRKLVEDLMVCDDWFELHVAQNLVLDGLLQPLVFREFEHRFSSAHGPALSLVTEFTNNWFDETSRWVDATVKTAAAESADNAARIAGWIAKWRAATTAALAPYADAVFVDGAAEALKAVDALFDARVAKLGIKS